MYRKANKCIKFEDLRFLYNVISINCNNYPLQLKRFYFVLSIDYVLLNQACKNIPIYLFCEIERGGKYINDMIIKLRYSFAKNINVFFFTANFLMFAK